MGVPPVGSSSESQHIVTEADTAHAWGNTNVHVLATPRLLQWIEQTTGLLWRGYRDPEREALLGTDFRLRHTGPALVGATVTIRSSVTEVDRRRVRYRFEGFDEAGPICEGWSENLLLASDRHARLLDERLTILRLAKLQIAKQAG